ncbi:GDSL-type esterase/lipase family protein [Nakamurella aerolata]|uniref:SGNH/GDSL hydrolase family protein n=1 Tax=Nakamurella aerolata TaxID=1656892 RepID=A0A849A7R9_9ACTN|nr:GDSL-type esterase/lipase family protein [Nakamurella aerolata]NNG35101.1 SGNH/GDSL hydrolase family protein [Nakamurella aerolata]
MFQPYPHSAQRRWWWTGGAVATATVIVAGGVVLGQGTSGQAAGPQPAAATDQGPQNLLAPTVPQDPGNDPGSIVDNLPEFDPMRIALDYRVKATLNLREAPSLDSRTVKADAYQAGSMVSIECQTTGSPAYGSDIWDKTIDGGYVPDAYISTGSDGFAPELPRCTDVPPVPLPEEPASQQPITPPPPAPEPPAPEPPAPPAPEPPANDQGKHVFPVRADLDGRTTKQLNGERVKEYKQGSEVEVVCQADGENAYGSTIWDKTSDNLWVPDRYVGTGSDGFAPGVPKCDPNDGQPNVGPPPAPEPNPEPAPPAEQPPAEQPPAEQPPAGKPRVVAMGDSYASGEAGGDYQPETNDRKSNMCHRSRNSWQQNVTIPGLGVTNENNSAIDYAFVSCSGAVAQNVYDVEQELVVQNLVTKEELYRAPQAGQGLQSKALGQKADYVLLSLGGNNFGFGDIVTTCLTSECLGEPVVADAENRVSTELQNNVLPTIRRISQDTGGARIVWTGYPQLMQGDRCPTIEKEEVERLDGLAAWLSGEMRAAAEQLRSEGVDIKFVDMVEPFKGHGACSSLSAKQAWINGAWGLNPRGGLTNIAVQELFHPNPYGQQAYVRAVDAAIANW